MTLQRNKFCKWFVAVRTRVGFLPSVNSCVTGQRGMVSKCLGTQKKPQSLSTVWIFMWDFRSLDVLKDMSQRAQTNGFTPVWTLMCLSRECLCEKDLSQLVQLYGFTPLCISMCFFKLWLWEKLLSQLVQAYGLSPEWVRLWTYK